jgi:hypothetical protein
VSGDASSSDDESEVSSGKIFVDFFFFLSIVLPSASRAVNHSRFLNFTIKERAVSGTRQDAGTRDRTRGTRLPGRGRDAAERGRDRRRTEQRTPGPRVA